MRFISRMFWVFMLLVIPVIASGEDAVLRYGSPKNIGDVVKTHMVQSYGRFPLSFEANQGQTDEQVKFLSRGNGYSLFLTPNEAVLALKKAEGAITPTPPSPLEGEGKGEGAVLRMKLVGANPTPQIAGSDELPGKSNYFIGKDPLKWRTNVPTYTKVEYKDVYPGVDLVYYGNQRQLEYDFIVAPGEDPNKIIFGFDGADRIEIDDQGDLVLQANGTEVRMKKPTIYQEIEGKRIEVAGRFKIWGSKDQGAKGWRGNVGADPCACPELEIERQNAGQPHRVAPTRALESSNPVFVYSFEVAAYDTSRPLIIDPVLVYSTYLGGNNADTGAGISVDPFGNAYVTGEVSSIDFPTVNSFKKGLGGLHDAYVTKLNASGDALIYSTYLGGSANDNSSGITVDMFGNAYLTGFTESTDFPTANPLQKAIGGGSDAFIAKIDATGSFLIYSTYLGGSSSPEAGNGIAVDSSGNAYVVGSTTSANFPTTPGAFQTTFGGGQDAFIAKIDATGSYLIYSTYLGGSREDGGSSFGCCSGIAVDSSGSAYVT